MTGRSSRSKTGANRTPGSKRKKTEASSETHLDGMNPVNDDAQGSLNQVVDVDASSPPSSEVRLAKRLKPSFAFVNEELKDRFFANKLDERPIVSGKSITPTLFNACGATKLFAEVGMKSFLIDMPKTIYPELIAEFYANLSMDKYGNCLSVVNNKRLVLNPPTLRSIIKLDVDSDVDVFTHGSKFFPDFNDVDQLNVLVYPEKLMELAPPASTIVNPMANLVFKVCWSNICPRLGNRSTFTWQDVCVCAMILKGRAFDLPKLIMDNMMDAVGKHNSGLPYGLLLTRIFEYFSIDFTEYNPVMIKDQIDAKNLAQSNLRVSHGKLDFISKPVKESDHISSTPSTGNVDAPPSGDKFATLLAANSTLLGEVHSLKTEVQEIKSMLSRVLQQGPTGTPFTQTQGLVTPMASRKKFPSQPAAQSSERTGTNDEFPENVEVTEDNVEGIVEPENVKVADKDGNKVDAAQSRDDIV